MKRSKRSFFKVLCASLLSVSFSTWLSGCSSAEKKSDTPEGAFAIAKEFEDKERYEEALKRYQEVRNKFPYSRYALQAELAIADVYFKQESFPEAQVAYQTFRELHPKHGQIDYVIFRIGLSFFKQLPSTIDRDLALAPQAIAHFEELAQKFPQSQHRKEADERKREAQIMLAQKEEYIADFYFKREKFDSALVRYEQLAKTFPGFETEPKALARAFLAAQKIGEAERAESIRKELLQKYPNHDQTKELQGRSN